MSFSATLTTPLNRDLRKLIIEMCYRGQDGHIPSAFSIVDLIAFLYDGFLRVDPAHPDDPQRDYFTLSKGHGCLALYAVLYKHGFINQHEMETFCLRGGTLGEHPDSTKIAAIEACTGSLGHGFPFSMGIALALQSRSAANRVITIVGDGESNEGTIWETALVAAYRKLGNFCVVVDLNGSSEQTLSLGDLAAKWRAFGWETYEIDGHSEREIRDVFERLTFEPVGNPKAIVAHTLKGKGISTTEGHGIWHHRIPNDEEYRDFLEVLR